MKLKYIKIEQPIGTLYLVSVKSNVLLSWTNNKYNKFFNSVVRNESEQLQIKEISLYCNNSDAVFPTPIVICIDNFYDIDIENGYIVISDDISNFADILDGHHRLLGISQSGNASFFELPVAIMFNLTKEEKAYIFSAINSNQRSAPNSQIYNLYDVTENRSPSKTAHLVARALNNIEESPFYRRLKMTRDYEENYYPITQSIFVENLLKLITKDAVGDANKLKNGNPLTLDESLQLRSFFINDQDVKILQIMYDCFSALKEVFPKEWKCPKEFPLWRTSGFVGVMGAMNEIIKKGKAQNTLDKDFFLSVFNNFKKNLNNDEIPRESEAITSDILKSNIYFKSKELYHKGEKEQKNGNYIAAIDNYSEAISLDPYYAEAYLNRGLLNYENGKEYDAEEDFDNAIAKKYNFAEAYYIRGLFKYIHYNNVNAINDIINAKTIKKDVVEALPIRSLLTGEMKKLDNSINGVKYSKDMKKLICVPKDKKDPFIILNSVTEIGDYAFSGCSNLTSIEIPNSVTEIGERTFEGCTSLSKIMIPNSVTEIGRLAFSCCTSLSKIMIPNSVTVIGEAAFSGCTSLISIEIPNSVTEIGDEAFFGCTSLTSIEIPYRVTEIGNSAFTGCTSLKEIHLKHKTPLAFSDDAFDRLDISKITLYVPKGSGVAYRNSEYYKGFKDIIEN